MVEEIIIGRDKEDLKNFGNRGTVFIGKHIVGEGDAAHLTNPVRLDVARPHIVLVSGKRGSGKSYTGSVIAEEITFLPKEIRENISVLMIDTMGIFWSMKTPNEKDRDMLADWNLRPKGIDIKLFAPKGFMHEYEKSGVSVDSPFMLRCSDLTATDWMLTFGFSAMDPAGLAVQRVIKNLSSRKDNYSIDDILDEIQEDSRIEQKTRAALENFFSAAQEWSVFEKSGTPIGSLFQKGQVSVVDISHYARTSAGWSVRNMLVGLLSRKIFQDRLTARKAEEFEVMSGEKRQTIPTIWIIIDEAHQFMPGGGETVASEPLLTLVKEGREPGISLVLITQRPNKLHPDALAQADIVISHMLTSKDDIDALKSVMQTYMLKDIQEYINTLPKQKGAAIILDDNSERVFQIQVRPKLSWHAGGSPSAIKKKSFFEE